MDSSIVKTSCPRDCFGGCTMNVHVKEGRIVKIEGEKGNKATDGILCSKGMSYKEYVYSKSRVGYPLLRVGNRGDGKFKKISWDEAIYKIGESIKHVLADDGPLSIMHYSSGGCQGLMSEYYKGFFSQMGGYTTTRGNLCYSAGIEAVKLTYGDVLHNAPWDIKNAKLIILWGKNPANTNIHEMKLINDAKKNGSMLITIDPIVTDSAKLSDFHISVEPGTDGFLALCILNLLIQNDAVDKEFVEKYTVGFEKLKEYVKKYDSKTVSKMCNVPEEDIIYTVEMIKTKRPLTLICGYGIQRYKNGGQTVRAISMIPAILGDIGISGGGFRFANKWWRNLNWPFIPETDIFIRDDYPAGKLAQAIEKYENPNIKILWVERANPLTMNPDINKLKKAFFKIDFLVVVDQFMTDTARYADIVLPAQSFFEYTDIFTGYWTPYISLCQKAIDAVLESKNESQIYRMLGEFMGYDMNYLPLYDESTLNYALKISGYDISVDKLKYGPYMREECEIAYKERKFNTPSGKIELYSDVLKRKWGLNPLCDFEISGVIEKRYPLRLLSTHARERLHSQFAQIKKEDVLNSAVLFINPKDASKRNIKDKDSLSIYNDRGEIYALAKVTEAIKEGVVNLYEGMSEKSGANVNVLTSEITSDIGFGAAYYETFVEVKKYEAQI